MCGPASKAGEQGSRTWEEDGGDTVVLAALGFALDRLDQAPAPDHEHGCGSWARGQFLTRDGRLHPAY